MKLFYGWVIVGVGMVVTCLGMGSMMSLGVYLQPMSQDMGWSRAGISFTAVLNFLAMGFGSFLWGSLSDRFGTRAVVLAGGVLLGIGLISASHAAELWQFQLLFGILVGLAAGSFYAPLIATITRWFTANRSLAVALVSSGMGLGSLSDRPAVAVDHHQLRLAHRDADDWQPRSGRRHPRLAVRAPPACPGACRRRGSGSRWTRLYLGAGAAHAAVCRDRAHPLRMLRGAFWTDLPHGELRDRLRYFIDDGGDGVRHHRARVIERTHRVRPDRRSRRRQADTDRRPRNPGACRKSLCGHQGHHRILCAGGVVRPRRSEA